MSAPVISEHDVTLHQGDAATVLAGMPAESVNCIVTSPPYFGLRDYGVDGQLGLEASPAEYVASLVAVFTEARRVLRADGVLWLNLGDSYVTGPSGPRTNPGTLSGPPNSVTTLAGMGDKRSSGLPTKNLMGIPWRVAFALQDDGWTLRNDVIWHKPNAMPESVTDRLSNRHEHVFMFSKSRRYWFDLDPIREEHASTPREGGNYMRGQKAMRPVGPNSGAYSEGGRNPGDVWSIPTQPYPGGHFATFPPDLVKRCIQASCPPDGTVLDPFAGSGTTLMVARRLGRKAVGIELNPEYCGLVADRIGDTPFDFGEASAVGSRARVQR